ncbi:MAG: translation initiation factor IF-2, partial [Opitutaceae bacterium]|nr:translation initiation factor IF-2 [Opitutaceae bacterium]
MSVRIHQLSKKTGIANKELISLLKERGFNVTSASSSIDNISADSLIEEFAAKKPAEEVASQEGEKKKVEAVVEKSAPSSIPSSVFVKSAKQVADEREKKLEDSRPKPAAPPPVSPKPAAPPVVSQPAPSLPPSPGSFGPPPVSMPQKPPAVSLGNSTPAAPPPMGLRPSPVSSESAEEEGAAETAKSDVESDSADQSEIRTIQVKPPIVVREFAIAMGVKPFKLISELMEMGIFASMNQSIEETVASKIAEQHGVLLDVRHRGDTPVKKEKKVEPEEVDESLLMEPRPPVVCILGHVDHGKTSLLDKIRSAEVVKGEAGGITQHIGAYQIKAHDKLITFLDTPGHAAFNKMRARGANVTDIAILVVAADDGFMPQTDEALLFIRKAGVTPIIAINKIDTKGANVERVKTQMQERDLLPEDWGGETITVEVSAMTGDGIDSLLEMILLQADVLELKANPKKKSTGVVIESQMEVGRGPTATVIIQSGTLKAGDSLVCGLFSTKVKAMFNDEGKPVKVATPSFPVRVIGWSGVPECGAIFETVKNDRVAKKIVEDRITESRKIVSEDPVEKIPGSVETLFAAMEATKK